MIDTATASPHSTSPGSLWRGHRRPAPEGTVRRSSGSCRRRGLHLRKWLAGAGYYTVTQAFSILGPDHPDTLTTRGNLAYTYRTAGRVTEAIGLYEQTLTDRLRILGPDHPDTLTTRNNLASAYQTAGRLGEAIGLFEQTLTDRLRVLGPDHPQVVTIRRNLAAATGVAERPGWIRRLLRR
ncbi:tetratricopeptide repeat protein [Protofrankia coriariae]|uniref:tetratricopeptide repeat protein n=1 Tax=Protofrankia coriariae TaxID=1562887 RepID=UPI000A31FB4B|nr:tetratricopeptide repeat protein [Protofrankia coriariae]